MAPSASDPEPDSLRQYAPTISPAISFGRYLAFWASVPKSDSGRIVRLAWAPKVEAKDADRAIRSLTIIDVTLSSCHAAVGFGDVHREQAQLATAHEQPSRDGPVLLLHAVELRKHLVLHELLGRAGDEALFLGEPLRRPHRVRLGGDQQPLTAPQDGERRVGGEGRPHAYILSKHMPAGVTPLEIPAPIRRRTW